MGTFIFSMNFTFLMQIFVAPVTTSTKPTLDLETRLPVNPNVVLADIGTIATDSEIGGHGSTAVQGSGLDHLATTTGQECAVSEGRLGSKSLDLWWTKHCAATQVRMHIGFFGAQITHRNEKAQMSPAPRPVPSRTEQNCQQ